MSDCIGNEQKKSLSRTIAINFYVFIYLPVNFCQLINQRIISVKIKDEFEIDSNLKIKLINCEGESWVKCKRKNALTRGGGILISLSTRLLSYIYLVSK